MHLPPRFFPQKKAGKAAPAGSVRSLGECLSGVPFPDVRENTGKFAQLPPRLWTALTPNPRKAMNTQGKFRAVCFDCDSTLSRLEGIDELASRYGRKSEVAGLTEAAMNGSLSIDDVYAKRLSIVRPDREAVAWLGRRYVEELVPGARETIEALRRLGKEVYVVSGGLLPSVRHLAEALTIPWSHVYAVSLEFDANGAYRGFDQGSPLPRADGKAVVCREIAERHGAIAMSATG